MIVFASKLLMYVMISEFDFNNFIFVPFSGKNPSTERLRTLQLLKVRTVIFLIK